MKIPNLGFYTPNFEVLRKLKEKNMKDYKSFYYATLKGKNWEIFSSTDWYWCYNSFSSFKGASDYVDQMMKLENEKQTRA